MLSITIIIAFIFRILAVQFVEESSNQQEAGTVTCLPVEGRIQPLSCSPLPKKRQCSPLQILMQGIKFYLRQKVMNQSR